MSESIEVVFQMTETQYGKDEEGAWVYDSLYLAGEQPMWLIAGPIMSELLDRLEAGEEKTDIELDIPKPLIAERDRYKAALTEYTRETHVMEGLGQFKELFDSVPNGIAPDAMAVVIDGEHRLPVTVNQHLPLDVASGAEEYAKAHAEAGRIVIGYVESAVCDAVGTVTITYLLFDPIPEGMVLSARFAPLYDLVAVPSPGFARLSTGSVASLERWKREALEVIDRWDALWVLLGKPGQLGDHKSVGVLDLVQELRAERDRYKETSDE